MEGMIYGVVPVLVGVAAVLWNNAFARHIIEDRNRRGYYPGERYVTFAKIFNVVAGTWFVVFGVLLISGVRELGR